jgi:hypothetical protein
LRQSDLDHASVVWLLTLAFVLSEQQAAWTACSWRLKSSSSLQA